MTNRIGRYEVQAELGRGGFGRVFRAWDPTVGRLVAIKTLTSSGEQDMLTRFRNEAAAAGRLRHQNIVIIYDFGEHDGAPFLVMELLDGEDLERIITSQRPVSILKKLDIMMQAAGGLHHAHSKGIVHRDVKPANIMLLNDGSVKIMDFGIALVSQATAARITPQGSMIGTLPYMSPEQFYGADSNTLTDIFAFGITFYKLLTGVHPFHAPEMAGLMYNITNRAPTPIRSLVPECPEALEQVIGKLLAKDRDSRYQTLEDAQFDLEPIILDLKKENVGSLLAEAKSLIATDQLEQAQGVVRQVIEIDHGNRTARELRENLQRQIKERAVRPQIAALVTAGREQLGVRQFDEAIRIFESALRLSKSDPELQNLIDEARTAWERAQRAEKLLAEARQALHREDFTAAHNNVADALKTDPGHAQAEVLLSEVQGRMEARRREQKLREGLSHIKGLMLLQSFSEAVEAATRILEEFPDSAEATQLLERARREQEAVTRRERLKGAIDGAKDILKQRRFAEAAEQLVRLQAEFPEANELQDLASYAAEELRAEKQAEVIARATEETRDLVAAGNFDTALDRLKGALAEYPGVNALRDLVQSVASQKAEHERSTALNEIVRRATAMTNEGRFSEAIESIGAFVRAYGDNSALTQLRKQAEDGLERQRRAAAVRKLILNAQQLIDEGKPGPALKVLQQGIIQFPGDSELTNLLEIARNNLREQQQTEEVSKIIADVNNLLQKERVEEAFDTISNGARRYPNDDRLLRCRKSTEQILAVRRKQGQALEQARNLHSRGKKMEALEAIGVVISQDLGNPALHELKQQIEAEIAEEWRLEEIRNVLAQGRRLLESGDPQAARQTLQTAARQYPEETEIAKLLADAEARIEERRRKEAIAKALQDAEAQAKTKKFDQAVRLLEEASKRLGSDQALTQAREAAIAGKAAYERERSVTEAHVRAGELRKKGRLPEALQTIVAAIDRLGQDPVLTELKQDIATELESVRRDQEAKTAVKQAKDLLARNDARSAIQVLERPLAESPNHGQLKELLLAAQAKLAEQQREQLISAVAGEVSELRARGQLEKALQQVDGALDLFPGEPRLAKLREGLSAEMARAESLALAKRLHQEGNLEAALQEIQKTLRTATGDRDLLALQTRIEADQAKIRQAAEIKTVLDRAQSLLTTDRPEDALPELQRAAAKYPVDKQISTLLRSVDEELQKRRRAKELEEIRDRAEMALSHGKPEEAVALIEAGYANEPIFQDVLQRARRQTDAKRREAAIQQAGTLGREGRYKEALQLVDAIIKRFGEDPGLTRLKRDFEAQLEARRREEGAQSAIRQAGDLLSKTDARSAVQILDEALAQSPGHAQLLELRGTAQTRFREQQRQHAIAAVAEEVAQLRARAQLAQALQKLDDALIQYPGADPLVNLRETISVEHARAESFTLANRLHQKGEFEGALLEVQKALRTAGGDRVLLGLLSRIEADLAKQRETAAIKKALEEAQVFLREDSPEEALASLQRSTLQYPGEKQLAALLQTVEGELQRRSRAKEVAKVKAQAETLLSQGKPEETVALIEAGYANEPGVQDLLLRARKQLDAKRRDAAIQKVHALGREGRLKEALQLARATTERFGEDAGLLVLTRDLEAQLEALRIEEEVQNVIRQANEFLARNDPRSAIQVLARALTQSPNRPQLLELQEAAQVKLREQQREQAIAAVVEEASKLYAKGQLDKALQTLDGALGQFAGDPRLVQLRQTVLAAQARIQSLALANRLHQEGKLEAALAEIQKALRTSAGDREFLELQGRVEVDLAKQKQAAEIRRILEQAQSLLRADRPEEAFSSVQRATAQYPGEKQLTALLQTIEAELQKRRRAKELEQVKTQAEKLLSQGKPDEAVALLEGGYANETAVQDLLLRARKKVDEKLRDAMLQQAGALGREERYQEAIQLVGQAVRQYGTTPAAAELQRNLQSALDQQLRRKARENDRTQLLSIEQEVATRPRKKKATRLSVDAQAIAAKYGDDKEIRQIAGRIAQAVSALPEDKGLSPRLLVGGGVGVAAAIGIGIFLFRPTSPTPPKPPAEVPVEIRTDPPGASIRIQDQSCITPNCRFGLKPGQYQLEARLNGYQEIHQVVNVELAKGSTEVNLTLQPLPPPPPTATTGTLIVQTGVPDALVYIDGTARTRTDPSGSVTLPLEAKTYDVRVERNGYEKTPSRQVKIAAGVRQTAAFTLTPQVAKLELRGAPKGVEVRVGGRLLGRTDGSPTFVFPTTVTPGDQAVQVTLDAVNRSIQRKFEAGQVVQLEWKDVAPPPNAEAIERQDWERVRSSSDVSQLRGYLGAHPSGPHAKEAASRIADLVWGAVDQKDIEAVRRFSRENSDNPHKTDAQKILDQYDAEQTRLAQVRAKQEQDQIKQDSIKQEQARQEQARQEQLKQEQARQAQLKLDSAKQALANQARKQQVLDTLKQLDSALQRKRAADVKAIWPGASSVFFDSLKSSQVEMSLATNEDVQFPQGSDQAVVHCDLATRIKTSGTTQHRKATFTLRNSGGNWTIEAARFE